MPSPLTRYGSDRVAVLPPRLFGPVGYYAVLAQYTDVFVACDMRYDKRDKAVHRFDIADTRGRLSLTVPVSRPAGAFATGRLTWEEVDVSSHGRWWEVMPTALESAYGRTPFFEYYIDRLMPLFAPRPLDTVEKITDLDSRADSIVRSILGLETRILDSLPEDSRNDDFLHADFNAFSPESYWQVRADRLGFLPGLSILDLIFNMGPEAPLYLRAE